MTGAKDTETYPDRHGISSQLVFQRRCGELLIFNGWNSDPRGTCMYLLDNAVTLQGSTVVVVVSSISLVLRNSNPLI